MGCRYNPDESEELVIPYAGWELVLPASAADCRYVAVGFHADGMSTPQAIAGNSQSIRGDVRHMDGGWVLLEMFPDLDFEVIDGSEYVTEYGG